MLLSVTMTLVSLVGCAKPGPTVPDNAAGIKHVILISIDTLRADFLSCYGHPFVKSPNIDRVASEGMLFENHMTAAPTTLASHTALLTGTYPHTHGVPRNKFVVSEVNVLLAEVLKEKGFATAAFIASTALHEAYNMGQGCDYYEGDTAVFTQHHHGAASSERTADMVTDSVLKWVDQARAENLFLFVHYFDVHMSYTPPPPYDTMYPRPDSDVDGSIIGISRIRKELRDQYHRDTPAVLTLKSLYGGEVTYTDSQIGRLLAELETRGIYKDALLIITSDHGENFDEHPNFIDHGADTFQNTVRAPLIIRFPHDKNGGRRIDRLVSNIDVMPSVLDWLEFDIPERVEGVSFAPLRTGDQLPSREPIFAEATKPFSPKYEDHPIWTNAKKSKCIRDGKWKLIHRPIPGETELYDLQADPNEEKDIYHEINSIDPALVRRLKTALKNWSDLANPLPTYMDSDPDRSRALGDIGYTGYDQKPNDGENQNDADHPDDDHDH
jgi:arylsulfatase A-like enzyme